MLSGQCTSDRREYELPTLDIFPHFGLGFDFASDSCASKG